MDILSTEEGVYPDRAKRWFKTTVPYTAISGGQVSIPVPSHCLIHGVKVKPTVTWDQPDIVVSATFNANTVLTSYPIGNVAPASDEYKTSLCFEAADGSGSNNLNLNFTGSVGSLTTGSLDVWLHLSRTI